MAVGSFRVLSEDPVNFEEIGFGIEVGIDQPLGNSPPTKVDDFLAMAILGSIVNDKKANEVHLLTYLVVVLT